MRHRDRLRFEVPNFGLRGERIRPRLHLVPRERTREEKEFLRTVCFFDRDRIREWRPAELR